jgi:hypothetical protein
MLAASPETPYALAASQPSSIRGKSGSKGIQHLWKVEGETKQLINARFQTSAPAQVVPIAVMTSDDLTSWQQAMQTALNDKVCTCDVLFAEYEAGGAMGGHVSVYLIGT